MTTSAAPLGTPLAHEDVLKLQAELAEIGILQEKLILLRQELLNLDRKQIANREALAALQRRAREQEATRKGASNSSGICTSCGAEGGGMHEPVWLAAAPSSAFVLLPHQRAVRQLEQDQESLKSKFKQLKVGERKLESLLSEKASQASQSSSDPGVLQTLLSVR
ncbi:hypothetical protein KFL_001390200 [Klebsormidium nitens]|uniref:Uncharacterized protein n=1 Tax=Klebsormidium nitens TaxID=105231 RepID=A0A1Y1HZP4_KLENI|nr:hypothetical protein KFL_001390200 [Klebsormidium nitens]|eukprot:GAQ83202.1 hypothetical protein KFL_001390200 [Klebsormidium nitens]